MRREPGVGWAFWYFQPKPMPRELDLDRRTVLELSRADSALGRLAGAGRLLPNPSVFVSPYLTREALASSRIEGTEADLSEVFQAEIGEDPSDSEDVEEVLNYQRALYRGIALLDALPLSLRLFKEVHKVLLTGVRGQERLPGEFRSSPVWIGGRDIESARFVPPPPDAMQELLADLERFLNEEPQLPLLIRCALMHYQFETIHPFLDGNGRIGRLLIVLMLLEQRALPLPLLYLSAYMEESRRDYYDSLQAVRERGEIQEWLRYFLNGVRIQAEEAATRAEKLVDLRERYRRSLLGVHSRAIEVVELLFSNPFVTVRRVESSLEITNQGARNLIDSLQQRGWLSKVAKVGRGGRIYWVCQEAFELMAGN